tara:strand:- start:907 stop:1200 length:294 start_codon:yes stop_codon:yes gene_type:complete
LLKITVNKKIWLKLGYAKEIENRRKEYGLPKRAKTELLKVVNFKTGDDAHNFEAAVHSKYIRKRLKMKTMEKFHTRSGANECYPIQMKDVLLEELSE